jgi:hypothetical protein
MLPNRKFIIQFLFFLLLAPSKTLAVSEYILKGTLDPGACCTVRWGKDSIEFERSREIRHLGSGNFTISDVAFRGLSLFPVLEYHSKLKSKFAPEWLLYEVDSLYISLGIESETKYGGQIKYKNLLGKSEVNLSQVTTDQNDVFAMLRIWL